MRSLRQYFFIFTLFLLTVTGCTQQHRQRIQDNSDSLTSINIVTQDGMSETFTNKDRLQQFENVDFLKNQPYQKVMRVYGRDCKGDVSAYITSYHPNGQPKQYLEVVNNRACGLYQEWFSNGVLKLEATTLNGTADLTTSAEQTWLFDGVAKVWDECGNLIADIPYCKGELEGDSIYYHSNGNIWKRCPYCQGKLEGVFEVFLENNELLQTTQYVNGIKNGPSYRYWNCDNVAADETYCNGLLETGLYYDQKGEIVAKVEDGAGYRAIFGKEGVSELHEYHNGVLDGEAKVFGKNSRIVRIYHIKKDDYHGEEIYYYEKISKTPQLVPKLCINWYEGKIQGVTKTWYDNGVLESQREMGNNKKHGLSTAWYRDGSIMLIEEYDHDKLVKGEYYKKGEKLPVSQISEGKGVATIYDAEGNFLRKLIYLNGKPTIDG